MNPRFPALVGFFGLTGVAMAQLSLVNFENPGWSTGAIVYPVPGSANAIVSRAQSSSGAQSLEIPAMPTATNGAALNVIRVTGAAPVGGAIQFYDFRLKSSALTAGSGVGLDPATQTTWDYSVLAGGLRLLLVKEPTNTTARITVTGATGTAVVLPQRFFIRRTVSGGSETSNSQSPDWIRITVRYDAVAQTSDLFINGKVAVESIPSAPGALPNSPASLLGVDGLILVRGHTFHSTWIDDIQVSAGNPCFDDVDLDGMGDDYETAYGTSPVVDDRTADPDGDGLANIKEAVHGTSPVDADTDDDGMPDAWEITQRLEPRRPKDANYDLDGDGSTNLEEFMAGSDPWDNPNSYATNASLVYVRSGGGSGIMDGSQTSPFDNIQTAIAVVADGGTVVLDGSGGVFSGYYNGSVYSNKFLHIHGVNNAIIDCVDDSGLSFWATSYSEISARFPYEHDPSDPSPVGPYYEPATRGHSIRDIVFRNCKYTAAIGINTSMPIVISRCRFENCSPWYAVVEISDPAASFSISNYSGGWGGEADIRDCVFQGNSAIALAVSGAPFGGLGGYGAIPACGGAPTFSVSVTGCIFENNNIVPNVLVVAIASSFTNCSWRYNTRPSENWNYPSDYGGTLLLATPALPVLRHCTFLGNNSGEFGAITAMPMELSIVTTPWAVSVPWGGPVSPLIVDSSILWGNVPNQIHDPLGLGTAAHSTVQDGFPGPEVSTVDPLFYAGTSWLQPSSPAIDAAAPASSVITDLAGQLRADKPGAGNPGTIADQGAYEFSPDTDGDGLADLLETLHGLDPLNSLDAAADHDEDGFSNATEIAAGSNLNDASSGPLGSPALIYVDAINGSDGNNGHPNPVQSISRALTLATAVTPAKTIILRDGTYTGALNRDWNFNGKAVNIRSINGPARAIVDLAGAGRAAVIPAAHMGLISIRGVAFRNGSAPSTSNNGDGGAIYIAGNTGAGPPPAVMSLDDCWFIGCTAGGNSVATNGSGGAIYILGHRRVEAVNCQFLANKAIANGGAVFAGTGTSFTAATGIFRYNEARGSGGAVYGQTSTVVLQSNSDLSFNLAGTDGSQSPNGTATYSLEKDGGAVFLLDPAAASQISFCEFTANAALDDGGAIYCRVTSASPPARSVPLVSRSLIEENAASLFVHLTQSQNALLSARNGGGIYMDALPSTFTFQGNVITRNQCEGDGGGIRSVNSRTSIVTSALIGNYALAEGGGLHFSGTTSHTSIVRRCTIVQNIANTSGGGGIRRDGGNLTLEGIILWWNTSVNGPTGTSPNYSPSAEFQTVSMPFSNAQGRSGAIAPMFASDGYRLLPTSRDRDAGGTLSGTDIDGEAPAGSADRGCDEFVDVDQDNMPDALELRLVNQSDTDLILSILDVLPEDDFDRDGFANAVDIFVGNAGKASNAKQAKAGSTKPAGSQNPFPTVDFEPQTTAGPGEALNPLLLQRWLDDGSSSDGEVWKVVWNTVHGQGAQKSQQMTQPGRDSLILGPTQIPMKIGSIPPSWEMKMNWVSGGRDYDYNYGVGLLQQPPYGPFYFIHSSTTPFALIGGHNTPGTAGSAAQNASKIQLEARRSYLITGDLLHQDLEHFPAPAAVPPGTPPLPDFRSSRFIRMLINGDNDNGSAYETPTLASGIPTVRDYDMTNQTANENDLVPFEIEIPRTPNAVSTLQWTVSVSSGADKIKLWKTMDKAGGPFPTTPLAASAMPARVFVEGIKMSVTQHDSSFQLRCFTTGTVVRTIYVTVCPFTPASPSALAPNWVSLTALPNGTPLPEIDTPTQKADTFFQNNHNLIPAPPYDMALGFFMREGIQLTVNTLLLGKGKLAFIQTLNQQTASVSYTKTPNGGASGPGGAWNITLNSPCLDVTATNRSHIRDCFYFKSEAPANVVSGAYTKCDLIDAPSLLFPTTLYLTNPGFFLYKPTVPLALASTSQFTAHAVYLFDDGKTVLPLGRFQWNWTVGAPAPGTTPRGTMSAGPWIPDVTSPTASVILGSTSKQAVQVTFTP